MPFLDSVATSRAGMLLSMLPPPTKPDLLEEVHGEMERYGMGKGESARFDGGVIGFMEPGHNAYRSCLVRLVVHRAATRL